MTVVDTDVLIDYLRGRGPGAAWLRSRLESGTPTTTTVITRFELLAGTRSAGERETVHTLLDAIPSLPLDDPAAERAAEVRRTLERAGTGIGMGDSLIAGIVLCSGGKLVTRNTEHFSRVPELEWAQPR